MEPLMHITIGDLLDSKAAIFPDNDCIVYPHTEIRWSYRRFKEITDTVARGMMAIGIEKGDHVAIWATNVKEWLIAQFATAKIGAVLITVNTNYKQFEIEYLLRQSDAKMLILMGGFKDSDYISHISNLCPGLGKENSPLSAELPCLKYLVYIKTSSEQRETPIGMMPFDIFYDLADNVSEEAFESRKKSLDVHDVINMQYTSGTTGFPKGVMLTHYNLTNNGKLIGDCMRFTEKDRLCIPVPLFHCFGCVLGVMASITHATSIIMIESFNPLRVMDALQAENCTAVHGVPTMFISMLEHPDFEKYSFPYLRTGIMAGSTCPIKVMEDVVGRMGARDITIVFGQTESSPAMTQTTPEDTLEKRVSTIGRLHPHVEGKIVDPETGLECPRGVTGEIVTRGYHIMKGYYKMPEATRQVIDGDGWLHTGDLGTQDDDGYFKVTGRLKDMIIRGGENIYPREIEEFLYTHPLVKDVQVVGIPDKRYGEEVMAFVILKEKTVTEAELIEYVKHGLSRHKAPHYIAFIDQFPMTASGKIQKYKLREQAMVELGLQTTENDIT